MTLSEEANTTGKKVKKASAGLTSKRSTRKKAKDKPKRPLSAYNYFFKTERQRILKYLELKTDPSDDQDPDEPVEKVVDDEQKAKLMSDSGKVSFEEMGKLIGRRWKAITPENLEKYTNLAADDAERYKKELAEYNERKEKGAMQEAQRNAMMAMNQAGGPGGRPDYYHPPPYHGHVPGPNPNMNMYGAPYSGGMGGPPYMGGPMYHNPGYGSGYPDYGNSYGSRNPPDNSYSQGGPPPPPQHSHHPSPPGPVSSSSGYPPSGAMDPYGSGPNDYSSQPPPPHHSGDPNPGGAPQSYGGSGPSSYPPPQQYGGYGGGPSSYPPPQSGGPQDQHGHPRWG